jgi:hypothetical protein
VNVVFFFVAALSAIGPAALLFWALRGASQRKGAKEGLDVLANAPKHVRNMAQIRQALDDADLQFAGSKGGHAMAVRLRRERRQVVLLYLEAIQKDFEELLRIARIIALLSPEVSSSREYERLRLSITFRLRLQMIRLRLMMGSFILPQADVLGQMVTSLARQIETATAELGERAALAAELAVQSDQ